MNLDQTSGPLIQARRRLIKKLGLKLGSVIFFIIRGQGDYYVVTSIDNVGYSGRVGLWTLENGVTTWTHLNAVLHDLIKSSALSVTDKDIKTFMSFDGGSAISRSSLAWQLL